MRSSPSSPSSVITVILGAVLVLSGIAGCNRAPSDLREWKPDDHDRTDEAPKGRGATAAPASGAPAAASADPTATLVDVTWRTQCSLCHGLAGRGDGPQGPLLHAPNLTLAAWQDKVTDDQIANTISTGKNRMPKFDFPPEVMRGLVARIRASKGK